VKTQSRSISFNEPSQEKCETINTKSIDDYPHILTAAHISEYLHISRRRVYELFQQLPAHGGIPNFEIGTSKRVKKVSFTRWLDYLELQKQGQSKGL
jgi:hypothetical protein